jgi:type IV pilus assembly protein PilY1
VPDSPVEYACQKNFIILITDGEPTKDDFDLSSPSDTAQGFDDFMDLIGDYNPDGETEVPGGCSECSLYLDDIAKYMHDEDFRPDFDGEQTMDIYSVGFATTAAADALLTKTAQVSDGLFFHTDNAAELTQALVNSISDIIEKSQSFTAATVPASRTTDGNNIFFSSFIPQGEPGFWEGHIKNYEFTLAGEIRDANGDCALDDPSGDCVFGTLLPTAPPFWDAADEVPAPASRNLGVSVNGTVMDFSTANLGATELGLVDDEGDGPADEIALYNLIGQGTQATTLEELADEIVEYFRGCDFGSSPCVPRDTLDPPKPLLGDVFHSNPVILSPPNSAINSASYIAFSEKYEGRSRVLYAGANDGFLHAFAAGTWSAVTETFDRGTGQELFGFMPWQVRERIQVQPLDGAPRDEYFVDGSPQAADVWFYSSALDETKETDEWHTVMIGGMREGGTQYYAIDITNPDGESGGPSYPDYLWEFPAESAADPTNAELAYMGQTWSDAIITRVRLEVSGSLGSTGRGYERWVAIFGAGFSLESEPNSIEYDPNSLEGRAVYVVDVQTGQILAAHRFDPAVSAAAPESEMDFAFASSPGVFDLDRDGFADVAYFPDLGGRVWRWQFTSTDTTNWTFERVLEAPVYAYRDKPSDPWSYFYHNFFFPPTGVLRQGVLWLGLGSGERHNLKFWGVDPDGDGAADPSELGDNNRFYVFSDIAPLKTGVDSDLPLTESDLTDVTNVTGCGPISDRGYYLIGRHGEKFVTTSIVFLGNIFTGSFIPVETTDPCVAGGEAWLWQFNFSCGEGGFPDESDTRNKKIGTGVPTSPRISVGSSEEDEDDECKEMKVVVITSDGKVISDCAGKRPNSGVYLREWRQD